MNGERAGPDVGAVDGMEAWRQCVLLVLACVVVFLLAISLGFILVDQARWGPMEVVTMATPACRAQIIVPQSWAGRRRRWRFQLHLVSCPLAVHRTHRSPLTRPCLTHHRDLQNSSIILDHHSIIRDCVAL